MTKTKKILGIVLAVMILTLVMSISVFADTVASPKGTLMGGLMDVSDPNETFVSMEIANLYATESVVIKLYTANDEPVATTTLQKLEYFVMDTLSVKTCLTGSSSSWSTVWENDGPRANKAPAYGILYVDGIEMNRATTQMRATGSEAVVTWAEINGVLPALVSTYEELVEALNGGCDVILANNIVCPDKATLTISNQTLDLGGYSLTLNGESGKLENGTIKNGTIEITTYKGDIAADGMFDVYGTSTVEDVTVHSDECAIYAIFDIKTGTLDMTGCEIDIENNSPDGGLLYFNGGEKITMTDCVVTGTDIGDFVTNGEAVLTNCTVTLKGTTTGALDNGFNGTKLTLSNTTVAVDGATGRGITTDGDTITITGNSSVVLTNCAEGGVRYKASATITVDSTSTLSGTVKVDSAATEAKINDTTVAVTGTDLPTASVTNGSVTVKYAPKADSLTFGFTKEVDGYVRVWGEAYGCNAYESFVIELYCGDVKLATTTLNNIGNIINGDIAEITWNFFYPESNDEYWTTTWEEGHPNSAAQPDKIVLYVDGVAVATNTVKMSGADNLYPVKWRKLGGVIVADLEGAGTEEDPYLISNLEELKWFRDDVNAGNSYDNMYIKLTADIDLANEEWTPIGTSSNTFNGMFDGDNRKISNLTISWSKEYVSGGANENYVGLFGYMKGGTDAGIKNVTVENADVTGCLYVGVILGRSYKGGIIENCHVTGSVKVDGYAYIGGVIGRHDYSKGANVNGDMMAIYNCSVVATTTEAGTINGDYAVTYVGGIVGFVGEGDYVIDSCSVENIAISGVYGVGGVSGIGHYGNTISGATVENITLTSTNNDPSNKRTGNVGLIAGAVQGTNDSPTVITGNTLTNVTGSVTYTDETTEEITNLYGNNMNGSDAVTNYVAEVNGVQYEALADAIAAANDSDTITLLRDVVLDNTLTIAKSITLDGNGHKLIPADSSKTYDSAIMVGGSDWKDDHGEAITLRNLEFSDWNTKYGVIRAQGVTLTVDGCEFQNCNQTENSYGVLTFTYCDATVTNCVFDNNVCIKVIDVNSNGDGSNSVVTVEDCIFKNNTCTGDAVGVLTVNDGASATIINNKFENNTAVANIVYTSINATISGNSFAGNKITGTNANKAAIIAGPWTAGEYEISINNNVFNDTGFPGAHIEGWTDYGANSSFDLNGNYWNGGEPNYGISGEPSVTIENYYTSYTTDENGNVVLDGEVEINYVAEVNGVKYEAIADAIANANEGDTVIILAGDYTCDVSVNKAIIVVGETDADGNNLVNITGKLNVTADGATVKNLNVNNGSSIAGYINAKDVLIEGCTIVGGDGFRYSYTSGTVTFKDSTITGNTYSIHFDGSAGGNIVIDNCVITGWTSFASTITSVAISNTKFAEGNYNQLRFYQNATMTNCEFNPEMTIDFGKNEVKAEFTDCTVTDGSPLTEVIYLPDIADMGIDVTVDEEPVVVVAKIGDICYLSIDEAFEAVQNGETITLYADATLTKLVKLENTAITIEGDYTLDINDADDNNLLKVYGKTTLNISSIVSGEVWLGDGAVLTNSTINGNVFVAGDVTFSGANSVNMLYDFGDFTDSYGAEAKMQWTVEKGASLKIVDKARYGLGYGDSVTIYGNIEDALTARESLTDGDVAFFAHGLVAQENSGLNKNNSFTVKDAYVVIGSNNSFGNKPGNYDGNYTFVFDNVVFDASRITFYEATSKTELSFTNCDVVTGTFMTRDADSKFVLTNTKLLSTTASNGNDEGNYNEGVITLINSYLTYSAALVNNGTITLDINSCLTAPAITGTGKFIIDVTNLNVATTVISADMSDFTGTIEIINGNAIYAIIEEGLVVTKAVAEINGDKYATLQEAFTAAVDGDTITLLADVTLTDVLLIEEDITVEGNNHTITSSASRVIRVAASATINNLNVVSTAVRVDTNDIRGISVDIVSDITLTLNNCSVGFTDASASDWSYAINQSGETSDGNTIIVNGGTYEGANVINIWGTNHKVTVGGATLTSIYAYNESFHGVCVKANGENNAQFTVKNSTFNGEHASAFGITSDNKLVAENNTDNTKRYVVKVGDTPYYSLAEAIENAKNGETVTLLADITLESMVTITGTVTLDLNGKTIKAGYSASSGNDCVICVAYGADLTIEDSVGTGIIDGSGVYGAIKMTNTGDNAENGTAKLTVNGGKLIGNYYAIVGNGSRHGTEIVINDGTITATNNVWGYGIFHPQDGTLTVNGGTIEAKTGIEMRGGTLTVNGGTIKSDAEEFVIQTSNSGTTVSGAAIAISQHNTDKAISVTVNGGELSGIYALYQNRLVNTYKPSVEISATIAAGVTVNGKVKAAEEGFAIPQAEDGSYTLVSVAKKFMYDYTNLTLGTDLSINFFYSVSYFDGENYYAVITKHHESTCSCKETENGEDVIYYIPFSAWGVDNSGKYKVITANDIAAKEMVCDVFITIYKGTLDENNTPSENSYAVSIEDVESITKHIDRAIRYMEITENTEAVDKNEKLYTLYADMLKYGAQAQIAFNHFIKDENGNAAFYASNMFESFEILMTYATRTEPEMSNAGYFEEDEDDLFYGTNLTLENTIHYNFWFKPGLEGNNVVVEYEFTHHDGTKHTYTSAEDSTGYTGRFDLQFDDKGYLIVSVTDLAPADLRFTVKVKLYVDGATEPTATIISSVEDHCANASSSPTTEEKYKELYKLIMTFADSAYAYLHQN